MALFRQMVECSSCGKSMSYLQLDGGVCGNCHSNQKQIESAVKVAAQQITDAIIITTETTPNLNITKRIDVISAQAAFEINNFKDMFVGFMNPVKGRSNELEKQLDDLKVKSTQKLKAKAHEVGANAVVAVDLDLSTVTIGSISMMMMMASGTAVVIED